MSDRPVVAIVHLGSSGAWGGKARVASLRAIFESCGATVADVPLLVEHRAGIGDVARSGAVGVLRGQAVPESMAWSRGSLSAELARLSPDVVVCVTARAYDPLLREGPWTVVLDYVDRLSDSYRDRATIVGRSAWAPAFRTLALTSARFERRPLPTGVVGIAAGWADAQALGLTWVPITFPTEPAIGDEQATHDLLFLGKLSYPPNVEAIRRLARLWPQVQRRRPGTSLLLAGASPEPEIERLAADCGWTLAADFDELADIIAQVRLGVVPLLHASGIQTKVLARRGLRAPPGRRSDRGRRSGPRIPGSRARGRRPRVDRRGGRAARRRRRAPGARRRGPASASASTYAAESWRTWASGVLAPAVVDGAP